MPLERAQINKEDRTVPVSFSSETPVKTWFGFEILDHSAGSVDLTYLNDSASAVLNHDPDQQFGVVVPGSAAIEQDRKGRCVIRFSRSQFGEEIFQDVLDGIRTKISVRYDIEEIRFEKEENGVDYYRVTKWEPIHVAVVADPADHIVGVNRSLDDPNADQNKNLSFIKQRSSNMDPKEKEQLMAELQTKFEEDRKKAVSDAEKAAVAKEEERTSSFIDLAEGYRAVLPSDVNLLEIAREFIKDRSKTQKDLSSKLLELTKTKTPQRSSLGDVDIDGGDEKKYSLAKVLRAIGSRNMSELGVEKEVSAEITKRTGRQPEGIYVPTKLAFRSFQRWTGQRAQVVGTPALGGNTVNEQPVSEISFVEYLDQKLISANFGAIVLPGLVGDVPVVRELSEHNFYWVGESSGPGESDINFSRETLKPKTGGARTKLSRQMLVQSAYVSETYASNKIMKIIRKGIDKAYINGTGSNYQPLGLKNLTGTYGVLGAAFDRAKAIDMMSHIQSEDAEVGAMKWMANPVTKGILMQKKVDEGSGIFLCDNNGVMLSYPVLDSTLLDEGDLIFGVGSTSYIGEWGFLDIDTNDKGDGWDAGDVNIRGLVMVDNHFEYPQALAISTGVN